MKVNAGRASPYVQREGAVYKRRRKEGSLKDNGGALMNPEQLQATEVLDIIVTQKHDSGGNRRSKYSVTS